MKITKFAQSCVLIETKGKRILLDPGVIQFEDSLLENQWKDINSIFVTHKHSDHCNEEAIKKIVENDGAVLYSTAEVAETYPELPVKVVKEGDKLPLGDINVEVVKAVHGYIPTLKGGNEIHENVGFIIDDGDKKAYTTSDSISFENEYKCDIIFVPVCNHGLVMGAFDAALFSKETGAGLVVPVHYDNPKYPANLELVESEFKKQGLNYRVLKIGESVEF